MAKKDWKKPKLVTIIRCKPEENVLFNCKTDPRGACGSEQTGPSSSIGNS